MIYIYPTAGINWVRETDFGDPLLGMPASRYISALAPARCNEQVMYVGFRESTGNNDMSSCPNPGNVCATCIPGVPCLSKKLYRVNNLVSGSATYTDLTHYMDAFYGGPDAVRKVGISGIAVNPEDEFEFWVTFEDFSDDPTNIGVNRVIHYLSTNFGISWTATDYSQGLTQFPVNCIVAQSGSNKGLYIGTDVGVYYRDATMSSWSCFNQNLPVVPVRDLEINYCTGMIKAATHGRGIYESPLHSTLIPITANPAIVCSGQSATLTITGSCEFSYQWFTTATGGTAVASGLSYITPSLTTATTFYVEATNLMTGCKFQGARSSITINVNPTPTVSIPGDFSVCTGTTVAALNFTSTPAGATITWTNSNPLIGLAASGSGNIPSFVASNPGVSLISGTITVTVVLNGCTKVYTYIITVTPSNCSGTIVISTANGNTNYLAGATTLGTLGATYSVLDDITINGLSTVVTITSPDMRFAPGKKIQVTGGATLIVNGAWLHACNTCNGMWEGIAMDNSTHVQIINGSVVEDARAGLTTTPVGSGVPDMMVNMAVFNKNIIDIKVSANIGAMTSFTVKNAVFTCRNITTPSSGNFTSNFNNLKAALTTNTSSSLAICPGANNISGVRSLSGIELNSLSNTGSLLKIGSTVAGATDRNIFDNLDYGVFLNSAGCEIKNSTFQNMKGNHVAPAHPFGIGVYAPAQKNQSYTSAVIGGAGSSEGNTFYDCYKGVEINNYYTVDIFSSNFICSSTPAFTLNNTIAENGISLKDIRERVTVNGSLLTNWRTGFWLTRNTISSGTHNPNFIVDGCSINANTSGSCNQAILLNDIATILSSSTSVHIKNNTITNVKNGIKASNIKTNLVIYNNPDISLIYTTIGTVSGIFLENCDKAEVKNNVIKSLKQGTYTNPDNWELRGIYVKTSTNNKIFCNNISSVGECMVFEGGCLSTTNSSYSGTTTGILGNEMANARTGLMLRTASGVIGQQGAAAFPSSNHWNGSSSAYFNGQTNSVLSDANVSFLYCLNSAISLPSNNAGSGTPYSGISLPTTTGTEITCPTNYVPAGMITGDGNAFRTMEASPYAEELKQLLLLNTSDNAFIPSEYLMQQFIYNEIRDHEDLQADSTLNFFYESKLNTAMDLFRDVDDEMMNQNYIQAQISSNNVLPANVIEENQFTFNQIYLPRCDSAIAFTEEEIIELYDIASQCALEGGNAVYQSRNLLMFIANNVIEFEEDCEAVFNNSRAVLQTQDSKGREIKLYPNPNNGAIQLDCNLAETESGSLIIYDSNGKEVKNYPLNPSAKTVPVNAQSLKQGSYMYEVIVNGKKIKRDKLIIIK